MMVKEACRGRSTSSIVTRLSGYVGVPSEKRRLWEAIFGTLPPPRQSTLTFFCKFSITCEQIRNLRENAEGRASSQRTKRHVSTSGGIESSYSLQSASAVKLFY